MKIFLDTADTDLIASAYGTGLIDGVTTNPSLILKSGRNLAEVIREISASFPNLESISAEVVGNTAGEMLKQAEEYIDIPHTTLKVPCTVEGLKVCKRLTAINHLQDEVKIPVNVTLIFSVAQAILAAKAGATYVSPFVGRWMDNSVDGIELIGNIRKVYDRMGANTKILAASIRDVRQVELAAKYGADVITIPPLVFWSMYKNVMTDKGLEQFQKDWEESNRSLQERTDG